jgi:hypothetical protein
MRQAAQYDVLIVNLLPYPARADARIGLMNIEGLPGEELIVVGFKDLSEMRVTIESLLVSIGKPRLQGLGFEFPDFEIQNPEHTLYDLLAEEDSDSAHSKYNALIRRLVSFERAAECVKE